MTKFAKCNLCGNFITFLDDKGPKVVCCNQEMNVLHANTEDASVEKHVPAVTVNGAEVSVVVGSVKHPMEPEHWIEFIYLETEKGGQYQKLNAGEEPSATFKLADDKPKAVYEYCNLHGLWKTEL